MRKAASGAWRSLPSYLAFYLLLVVSAFGAWQGRKQVMGISSFRLPDKANLPFSGDTVANSLQDHLAQIVQEIDRQRNDKRLHATDMHSLEQPGLQIPPQGTRFTRLEVPKQYAVEVKGLSYDGLIAVARAVMGTETMVSGDLVLEGTDGGKFILIARTESKGPWRSDVYPQTADGLRLASKDLAEKIFESQDPVLAGVLFLNQGQVERALGLLKQASETETKDLALKLALCQAMEANEFYGDAVGCYAGARNMNPSSLEEIDERLAQANWLYGNRDGALQSFEELAHKRHYRRAFLELGKALDDLGEHDKAISAYDKFLKAGADSPAPQDLAIVHVGKATAFANLGNHKESLAEFQMALDVIPGDPLILIHRSVELANNGDLDAGITELQSIVEQNKSADVVSFALYQLGDLFERKGEFKQASEQFRAATERRPGYKEAHDRLAKCLTRLHRLPEAFAEFSQTARLSSNLVDRKYAGVLANQWLGNALQGLRDYAGAASAYQEALRLKPDYRIAHSELGHVFEQQKQLAQAVQEYRKALAAAPNELDTNEWFVITNIRLGQALLREGNNLEAVSKFRRAIELETGNAEAHYGLAVALYKQGREQEAAAHCQAAGELPLSDPVHRVCPQQPAPREPASTSSPTHNSAPRWKIPVRRKVFFRRLLSLRFASRAAVLGQMRASVTV